MKLTTIMAVIISITLVTGIGILTFAIYDDQVNDNCGLSLEAARAKVIPLIQQKNLPIEYLTGPIDQRGSCRYGFSYHGMGESLYFVVESTWSEGVKVIYFDYIRQNQQ